MTTSDVNRDEPTSPALARIYQELCGAGFGRAGVPINWFTAQAARPDILATTWGLAKGILVEGQLPPTLKQMIALTLSVQNKCRYCQVTHTGALQRVGVQDELIKSAVMDPEMSELPPPHRAALKFAMKAARSPHGIDDEDYRALAEAGFTKGETIEIVMMAAFTQFVDTWADAARIPLDSSG